MTDYPALTALFKDVFNDCSSPVHLDVLLTHQIYDDDLARAKYEFTQLQSRLVEAETLIKELKKDLTLYSCDSLCAGYQHLCGVKNSKDCGRVAYNALAKIQQYKQGK